MLALGEESVHRSDFDRHVKALEARNGGALEPAVREALIGPFLEERVLVLDARTRGLLRGEATAEEEQAAVQKLLTDEVLSRIEVGEAEAADYFGAHGEEFRIPESVTLRQILVPTESEARDIRRRLTREPKAFDILARTRSHSPEASTGGLMGSFPRGQLPPELEAAAFALPAGGMSDVITTPLGYHVLKVDARQAAHERTLEECRSEVLSLLRRRKSDQGVHQFVQGLLARAKVNHEAAHAAPAGRS